MQATTSLKAALSLGALIAIPVGLATILAPDVLHGLSGIVLDHDPSLMSEIRGPGGVLLIGGIVMASGVIVARFTALATALAAMIGLGYGVSRLVSLVQDGMPDPVLFAVMIVETLLGAFCAWALIRNEGRRATAH
jgi:Domain of unknown function (DUF4345)